MEAPSVFNSVMACNMLGHRMQQLPLNVCPRVLRDGWLMYLRYRGEAIESITAGLHETDKRQRAIVAIYLASFWIVDVSTSNNVVC
jgi:hypothetical protein